MRGIRPGIARAVFFVLLVASWLATPVAGQQGMGAISGTAQDASGAPIPGVTVMLSNPGTIGGRRETVTDERGGFQFPRLVPGTYGVRGELVGFRPAAVDGLIVNADATARVDLKLEVGQISEEVTVSGVAPLLDTTTTLNQTVIEQQTISALPVSKDLWSIGRLVPGVVVSKYDVGGADSFDNSILSVHGTTEAEGKYMVDGMDVSYAGGSGSTNVSYFDTFQYQEINYQAGNSSAEYSQGGVVYNMVTKTGTNQLRGSMAAIGTGEALQANNISPDTRQQLLAAVPPRVLAANPNINPNGSKILKMYDISASVSGPILRNKLWFTAAAKLNPLDQTIVGSYNPDGTQFVQHNRMKNGSFKVSWQAASNSQLHFSFNRNNKGQYDWITGVQFAEPKATVIRDQKIKFEQLKWTGILSSKLVVDVGGSLQHGVFPTRPPEGVGPGDLPRYDAVTGVLSGANPTYTFNPQYRGVVNSSVNYVAGVHNLKFGYQFTRTMFRTEAYSTSHYPAGLRAVYRNGVPDSVNTYNTPTDFRAYHMDNATYLQDKWTPLRRLTLNLGLRLEQVSAWMPEQCQEQTVFIDAQCFPPLRDVPNWVNFSPRFGLVYDLFGNGRTALKFGANRYNIGVGTGHALRINPIRVVNDTRSWNDRNGDLVPQLDELGASTGYNLGTTNRYNPDLKRTYSFEINTEVEHQLPGNILIAAAYVHREVRRQIGTRNVAVPLDSYIPLQVVERTSGEAITVYNQNPALLGRFDVLWDNFAELDGSFNGVDLSFSKRMSANWMVMGGVSLGENIGDIYGTSDLNNPNFTFRRGLVGNDVPVSFKTSGQYILPHKLSLSATVQHFTGFPELDTVRVASNTVALTQVTQSVAIASRGTVRLPDVNMVDLSLKKTFELAPNVNITPSFDVFNLTNGSAVTARLAERGPAYHRASKILGGRLLRFGAQFNF